MTSVEHYSMHTANGTAKVASTSFMCMCSGELPAGIQVPNLNYFSMSASGLYQRSQNSRHEWLPEYFMFDQ